MCYKGGPRCKGYCTNRLRSARARYESAKNKYDKDKSPENEEKLRKAKNALQAAKNQYADSTAYIDDKEKEIAAINEKLENENLTKEQIARLEKKKEKCQQAIDKCKEVRQALIDANKADEFEGQPGLADNDNNHTYSRAAVVNAANCLNGLESGELSPDDVIAGKNGTPQKAAMVELAQMGTNEKDIRKAAMQCRQQYEALEAQRLKAEELKPTRKEKSEMKKLAIRNKELEESGGFTIEESKEYEKNAARLKELQDKQAAYQAAFTPQQKRDRIRNLQKYNTACDAIVGRKLLAEGKLKPTEKGMAKIGKVLKENGYTEGIHGRGKTPSFLYKEKNPQRAAKTWGKGKEQIATVDDIRSTHVASSYDSMINAHYDATVTTGRLSDGRWVVVTKVQGKVDKYGSEAGQGSHHREGLGRSTKDSTKTKGGSFPVHVDYSPAFRTKTEMKRWRSKHNAELLGRNEYKNKVTPNHITSIVTKQIYERDKTMAQRNKVSLSVSDHTRPLQENIAGHNNPTL